MRHGSSTGPPLPSNRRCDENQGNGPKTLSLLASSIWHAMKLSKTVRSPNVHRMVDQSNRHCAASGRRRSNYKRVTASRHLLNRKHIIISRCLPTASAPPPVIGDIRPVAGRPAPVVDLGFLAGADGGTIESSASLRQRACARTIRHQYEGRQPCRHCSMPVT